MDDQHRFASLTGDINPIHVDPLAARRTAAGGPVVHGVHLLYWALDLYAASDRTAVAPKSLSVQFSRFVLVGDVVDLRVVEQSDNIQLRIERAGLLLCLIRLTGRVGATGAHPISTIARTVYAPIAPIDIYDPQPGFGGRIPFACPPTKFRNDFPKAAAWLGVRYLAALGASTRLVGMVIPGTHSIYVGLNLEQSQDSGADHLLFELQSVRHGLFTIGIEGGGLRGAIRCITRARPARQPSMEGLRGLIVGKPFANTHSLVIGGSRGLGELAAKLLATGGSSVTITYNQGRVDAEVVAAEICAHGGRCGVATLQIGNSTREQLDALTEVPTHAYYFAAPTIAAPSSTFFDAERLTRLCDIFVDGFWSVLSALRELRPEIRLFYPSTSYIDKRPKGMAEYIMAKGAAELLCEEVNATLSPTSVVVKRLPPLATDQTAGMTGLVSSVDTLLPFILETQRAA